MYTQKSITVIRILYAFWKLLNSFAVKAFHSITTPFCSDAVLERERRLLQIHHSVSLDDCVADEDHHCEVSLVSIRLTVCFEVENLFWLLQF